MSKPGAAKLADDQRGTGKGKQGKQHEISAYVRTHQGGLVVGFEPAKDGVVHILGDVPEAVDRVLLRPEVFGV
jgi:hypothetical protein